MKTRKKYCCSGMKPLSRNSMPSGKTRCRRWPGPASRNHGVDFIFSIRWHLAGLSAVWMVVLLLSLDSTPGSTLVIARDKIPSARVLLASLLKNRRELMELTGTPPAGEPVALPPRRSENQSSIEVV